MKIRLAQPGFEGFTGMIGPHRFEDGEAEVSFLDAQRIGAAMFAVDVDTGEQVGPAARMVGLRTTDAPVETIQTAPPTPVDKVPGDDEGSTKLPIPTLYTYAELAAIADAKGIAGLREVGAPLGVKGRAIAELVAEIARAQNNLAAARGVPFDMGQPPVEM